MASILPNNTANQENSDSAIIITSTMDQPEVPSQQTQIIHQVPSGKHQVLPVVYIQAPPKINNSKSTNNVIFNFNQLQNLTPATVKNKNLNLTPVTHHQSLLLGGKQPLIIQKTPIPVAPKNGVTYLTMLKKGAETNAVTTNRFPISAVSKLKHEPGLHLALASSGNSVITNNQKIVFTPMPKVTNNRLPVTMTTNSVQPKFSFMPITIPNANKHKVINFKIADGQIKPEQKQTPMEPLMEKKNSQDDKNLLCMEMIDLESPEKNLEEQSYQISIIEDDVPAGQEPGYTISINEDGNKADLKDTPKLSKHGVSILKKTCAFLDKKEQLLDPQTNFKTITTISDSSTKEVKISSEPAEEAPVQKKKEGGRRRKSTICVRKDYQDEIVESKIQKLEEPPPKSPEEPEDMEIYDDVDVSKLLDWEDGIGTLPGSDLKFHINEFGFLEYLTKEEFRKILFKKQNKIKDVEKKKIEMQEMRCLECGCYGMPSEFISPKYCSRDCEELNVPRLRARKVKRVKTGGSSDEDTSTENSLEKYPWVCDKRGFSWSKYLHHFNPRGEPAPVKLFKCGFPYNRNGFRSGMKLEGIDPQHPSYFCILTVAAVTGYRLRLHFDGYPDNYDFWVNADSMDIFPTGFCEKYGHILHPPPGYGKDFNWNTYLKETKSPAAPRHFFTNRPDNAIFTNGFRVGMKLEAVDRKNTSLVCVATITDLLDNRILVHFDSWDDIYDYWADPTSPYIHPVGWCDQNGHSLTPPNDYPNPESFTWERYLKETKSSAAPARAFKPRPANGFRKGMRLEAVDRRVPQLIRVATVDDVRDHQVRISFDGWPDRYSYYVDDDSTEIYPVGWCHKTGHTIQPPLTPDDVYDFLECATVGCKGVGHIKGPGLATHTSQKYCPYAEENIDIEKILPDRLLSPDSQIEAVVPVSREPRVKGRLGRPPKLSRVERKPEPDSTWSHNDTPEDEEHEPHISKEEPMELPSNPPSPPLPCTVVLPGIKKELPEEDCNSEEYKMREKHLKYLENYIHNSGDPRDWNSEDVANFVVSLPHCKHKGYLFSKNKIDGVAFLMLTQQDIVDILNIKLGPAIILYNCILLLRKIIFTSCT